MLKRLFFVLFLSVAPVATFAQDSSVRDKIITILREDGFSEVRISRTLLGRMRFVAENAEQRREIVVNPATGVILRDYVRFLTGDEGTSGFSGLFGSSGNGESNFDNDDPGIEEDDDDSDTDDGSDDDDDDDDDDGSDESDGSDSDDDSDDDDD